MESNRSLLLCILGISLLPKIYSDTYPPLIVKKTRLNYAVADEIQYVEDQSDVLKFSTSPQYQLYYACPEENAPIHQTYALQIQESLVDIEAKPLQQFFEGYFAKYNCPNPIKPIVLQSKQRPFKSIFMIEYDIGFLIHQWNPNFGELWKKYLLMPKKPEYNLIVFLTLRMDWETGAIMSVRHVIMSRGLEQNSALDPLPPNDNNFEVFKFDLNFLYSEENQKNTFSLIFGESFSRYYDHQKDRYLLKVQLAPHEDFLLNTWKLPSLMDLNTAAMWKQLYPQWKKVETFVREVARNLETLIVETGTAKILLLAQDNNKLRFVFLRKKRKSPVSQYFWKMVRFEQSSDDYDTEAVLIVMHNDPYTENQIPICNDMGEIYGWMVSNKDYKTGLTYVCPVNEIITRQLYNDFKAVYAPLNLNIVQKLKSGKNDSYPSLFIIKKSNNNYAVADKFQYIEGENNAIKFSTSPEYRLYNACPEKNAHFYRTYTLKVQESVTDFEARPLQQFVQGDFVNYNCSNPIKPVALKFKKNHTNQSMVHIAPMMNTLIDYNIGFLIREKNGNFDKLSEKYENFTEIQEYDFLPFVTIRINTYYESALEACHHIVSGGLLETESAFSDPIHPNEKNFDISGFHMDSLYTRENQSRAFSKTFPRVYSHYYSYPNRCLRKIQLVPHEDFLLNTWKAPTFMDMNTTAMWEQLYLQWRRVEVFVRKVARELDALVIQTGVSKILNLPFRHVRRPIYLLENQKVPVRKYAWKLIKLRQSDNDMNTQAILIVMHNDPYSPDQEPICKDVSENWGWMVSNNDYKTGLTYGCQVVENITSQLYNDFKVNYPSLNLNNVQKLEYDQNGESKWVYEDIASKIRGNIFPSLFIIKKPDMFYTVANKFEYVRGQDNVLKFSISPEYPLYNACPEENAPFHPTYALKVQELVKDFEASPLQQFVQGDFVKYNCRYPIKPIVLKSKNRFEDEFVVQYDYGFLIHKMNGNFDKLSKKYENFNGIQGYDFVRFLAIIMDRQSGTIITVFHRISSKGLLEPESAYSEPYQPNEKNLDVYGFDVDSLYTEKNQNEMFSSIFGTIYFRYYNHPNRCLIKIQLAPHEDFLLNTWKLPSFTELNTTAMWKQLCHQWRRIEIFVRKVVRELVTLTIATGAARILTIADVKGQQRPLYLREKQKSPVTKYFWKLIKFEQVDDDFYTQAILIVMHNDPYNPNQKPICNDVSENWGWMVSNKDHKTGLTYGCKVVGDITSELHDEYKVNYADLNLNDVQMLEYDENDIFPSLFIIKKPNKNYTVADKIQYFEGRDIVVKFSIPPEYQLYNACPDKNESFHPTYALKVQQLVTDFEASPLQQFVEGDFVKYNCWYPIKPIVLKFKKRFRNKFVNQYDIGFLIQENNGNFNKLSELYENFTALGEYNFLHFLTIKMDRQWGTTISVLHKVISNGLLEPESAYPTPIKVNQKNVDVYGFNVNSLYTEENQRKMFSSIFRQSYTEYYNPPNQNLRKVQLAPQEDFLLNTWKLTSLVDLNTAAMWVQLYSQWRRIEIFVRKVAREMDAMTIETGAARILSLPDAQGKQQLVYLREEEKSPVLRYFWKLVKLDQSNYDSNTQAVLIIMHNDPYTPDQEPICDDVSESWGWVVSNKDYETGLTYGCKVEGNIMRKLHDEYIENYENFDLKAMHKLE